MNRSTLLVLLLSSSQLCAAQPNIVFIYTDDQAADTIRAAGNDQIHTPNLDRLCKQGMRFTNAFVTTPVCSPARATLMTGRYASELKIYDWINPRREQNLGLTDQVPTWPQVLSQAGYATALIGKWHLGTADRFHPTKRGYQTFIGFRAGGMRPKDPILELALPGRPRKMGIKHKGLTIDILTDMAIRFIEQQRQNQLTAQAMGRKPKPFVVSVHYRAPHAPWLPVRPADWAPYRDLDPKLPDPDYPNLRVKRVKRMTREYLASISSVDRNVGRLMKALADGKLRSSTIVIYTSDHGYHAGHGGLWYKGNAQWQLSKLPKQRWKHIGPRQRPNLFDQALRVPLVVRWPNVVKRGAVNRRTITNLDWFKTLAHMAAATLPQKATIRGRSIVPLLKGQQVKWNDEFFAEYSMRHGAKTRMKGIRTTKWKFVVDLLHPGRMELYDLAKDPRERTNLANSKDTRLAAIREELAGRIMRHFNPKKGA